MRTKFVILGIVLTCNAIAIGIVVAATLWMGWVGLAGSVAGVLVLVTMYVRFVRPWHSHWGATAEEISRPMPGDDIITGAASTTRAISIDMPPAQVWPWLVQIGYGRAGWYSYDWIDNDGRRSSTRIVPELQDLRPGDRIDMMPGWGPKVVEVSDNSYFVAGDGEGGTWCLALFPDGNGCRLLSRWRQNWKRNNLRSWFFITFADPGAFIMEQKMLRGIKRRAEFAPTIPTNANIDPPKRRWSRWPIRGGASKLSSRAAIEKGP